MFDCRYSITLYVGPAKHHINKLNKYYILVYESVICWALLNIQWLKRRMTTMTDSKLEFLRDADHITFGTFELLLNMRDLCGDCSAQYQVSDLLKAKI